MNSGTNIEAQNMKPPMIRIGTPIIRPIRLTTRIVPRRIKSTPPMNIFFLILVV